MLRALTRTRRLISATLLVMIALAGCAPTPAAPAIEATAPNVQPKASESQSSSLTGFGFPTSIDPGSRYLFYLHGQIVEDQGLAAVSPQFGAYEYEAILRSLQRTGLTVISELRTRNTSPSTYTARLKKQVGMLKEAGVPSGHITVVGASKGAYIAALSSYIIKDREINYVLLATCYPGMADEWKSSGMRLYGNVLAIRDEVDGFAGSCEPLFAFSEGRGLGRHHELVLHVGAGHGIVYHPLDEWLGPTLEWAAP